MQSYEKKIQPRHTQWNTTLCPAPLPVWYVCVMDKGINDLPAPKHCVFWEFLLNSGK